MRKNTLELGCFDQDLMGLGASKKSVNSGKFGMVVGLLVLENGGKHGLKVLIGRIFTGLKLKALWGEKGLKNSS